MPSDDIGNLGADQFNIFCRRQFQMHFLERKCISIKLSLNFVPMGAINNISVLVSDSDLASTRRQAIT